MGEVIRFISRAERERARLMREARAQYDSVFPSSDRVNDRQHTTPQSVNRPNVHHDDESLS